VQDFAKQKQETDDRVNDVVSSGRQLVSEGVIPSEKREKFEFDLESIPGNWDGVVNMAEESKTKYVIYLSMLAQFRFPPVVTLDQ
jgi:hypothetical protein